MIHIVHVDHNKPVYEGILLLLVGASDTITHIVPIYYPISCCSTNRTIDSLTHNVFSYSNTITPC